MKTTIQTARARPIPASLALVTAVTIMGLGTLALQHPSAVTLTISPLRGELTGSTQARTASTIRGRVVDRENAHPLRRALVRALTAESQVASVTTTSEDGTYELVGLPPGRYSISATKVGYVGLSYGQVRPFEAGKLLDIGGGQTVEKLDFQLPRGSVITGRVVDELGDPVPNAAIAILRFEFVQGQRRLAPIGRGAASDDTGQYRVFGLIPSRYFVSAALRSPSTRDDDDAGYAVTYYPSVANAAMARAVRVDIAQTVKDIDIVLIPARTFRISGSVYDSGGRPMSNSSVSVVEHGEVVGNIPRGRVLADGTFIVSGLGPGDYTLSATGPTTNGGVPDVATVEVSVADGNIAGVRLGARAAGTVTGRIVIDPAVSETPPADSLRVMTTPTNPNFALSAGSARQDAVKDDLSFEVKGVPGRNILRVKSPLGKWTTKAVRLHGTDFTDAGIDFKSTETVAGVEIEVTNRATEVSGRVSDDRQQSTNDYTVVVFPRDSKKWTFNSRYVQIGRPDQSGQFKIRGLPPGDYYAAALDYLDPNDAHDPEYLAGLRDKAAAFSLADGETKTLDLRMKRGG